MKSRGLLVFALAPCLAACAALGGASQQAPAAAYHRSAGQEYSAGLIDQDRGDFDAARQDWDRCVAAAPADSPLRLDCLVALEKLSVSTAPDGKE